MSTQWNVLVLPGDGIGPEVTAQAVRLLQYIETVCDVRFQLEYALAGGCAIDAHGTSAR